MIFNANLNIDLTNAKAKRTMNVGGHSGLKSRFHVHQYIKGLNFSTILNRISILKKNNGCYPYFAILIKKFNFLITVITYELESYTFYSMFEPPYQTNGSTKFKNMFLISSPLSKISTKNCKNNFLLLKPKSELLKTGRL